MIRRRKNRKNDKIFDKQYRVICFRCGRRGDIRPNCSDIPNRRNPIHNLSPGDVLGVGFEPYLGKMIINAEEREYLRDSGSCLDVVESNMISVDVLLPELVWVKQPFDLSCRE